MSARSAGGNRQSAGAVWLSLLVLVTFGAFCTRNEGRAQAQVEARPPEHSAEGGASPPYMRKCATQEASFVLYAPDGWTCTESADEGIRTVSVTDPASTYEAALSYGSAASADIVAQARAVVATLAKECPGLQLGDSMCSRDRTRVMFDGTYAHDRKGRRDLRCWLSVQGGSFCLSRIEGPHGRLDEAKQLLLTVLSNVRLTRGSFGPEGSPESSIPLVLYRLSDGSASFKKPRDWAVQEMGSGQFVASDRTGSSSFIAAAVEVLSPNLGVSYPGAIVSRFLRPHEALRYLAAQQGITTDMQFSEINPHHDLEQQMSQVYTLGSVIVEDFVYTCRTAAGRTKGFTFGISFGSRLGTNWTFRHLTVAAPAEGFDLLIPAFTEMLASYQIDEAWARDYVRAGQARLRQMQRRTAELVSRNAQEIRETMQAAYDERQRSLDYIDYQRTNYIRGQQDWVSALEGGTVYHTDNWGTKNTGTGEHWEGQPFDYVHFTGENPKYREQMTPIDSRQLWEEHIR